MKNKELRTKNESDLKKLLVEKEEALRNFRLSVVGSKTRNIREGREIRRMIARIKAALKPVVTE